VLDERNMEELGIKERMVRWQHEMRSIQDNLSTKSVQAMSVLLMDLLFDVCDNGDVISFITLFEVIFRYFWDKNGIGSDNKMVLLSQDSFSEERKYQLVDGYYFYLDLLQRFGFSSKRTEILSSLELVVRMFNIKLPFVESLDEEGDLSISLNSTLSPCCGLCTSHLQLPENINSQQQQQQPQFSSDDKSKSRIQKDEEDSSQNGVLEEQQEAAKIHSEKSFTDCLCHFSQCGKCHQFPSLCSIWYFYF